MGAISAVVFITTQQSIAFWELHLAREEARSRIEQSRVEMEQRDQAFDAMARELVTGKCASRRDFEAAASRLVDEFRFASVEWHPQVTVPERKTFEHKLFLDYQRPIQLVERSPIGKERPPRENKTVFPARYAWPPDFAAEILGVHRANLVATRRAASQGKVVVTAKRWFYYRSSGPAFAYCYASKDGEQPGYLLGTLSSDPFRIQQLDARSRIIGRLLDVTPRNRAMVLASNPLLRNGQFMLPRIWVGGWVFHDRRLRWEVFENPLFDSPFKLIPWLSIVSGPFWLCYRTRKRWRTAAYELARSNDTLRDEIDEREHMQQTLKHLLEFREQERQSIANEIHDGFVQEAFGAQMFLESLSASVSDQLDATARSHLQSTHRQLERCIGEARQLVSNLQPSVIEQLGFVPAVENLVHTTSDRYGLTVNLHCSDNFPQIDINTQRALYRIIQESLANIRKHSGAEEAAIILGNDENTVYLEISDSGRGFDQVREDDSGFGLRGIRDRADNLRGTAEIHSVPGQGTCVRVEVPYGLRGDVTAPQNHHPENKPG